jgi:hypothetical protein
MAKITQTAGEQFAASLFELKLFDDMILVNI